MAILGHVFWSQWKGDKVLSNHGLCGCNKLYKRCAFSIGEAKFRPHTAPTFFFRSFWNSKLKKHIWDANQRAKLCKDRFTGGIWANTQILAVHSAIPFFIFLYSSLNVSIAPRDREYRTVAAIFLDRKHAFEPLLVSKACFRPRKCLLGVLTMKITFRG